MSTYWQGGSFVTESIHVQYHEGGVWYDAHHPDSKTFKDIGEAQTYAEDEWPFKPFIPKRIVVRKVTERVAWRYNLDVE